MVLGFPTTQEVTHVVRNRLVDPTQFIGAGFCPVMDSWSEDILYDVLEASKGMTKAHLIGTDPKKAKLAGQSEKRMGTGFWKETYTINEKELLFARKAGTLNERAGRDTVLRRSIEMDDRLETRLEWLRWQPLISGLLNVDEDDVKYTIDYGIPSDNKPELTGDNRWSVATKADPLANIMTWLQLFRGTGARGIQAYFNQKVAGYLAQSSAIRDLLKGTQYAKLLGPSNISEALKLIFPQLDFMCYDEGYTDESSNYNPFIPNDRFVIRGQGQVGELMMDFGSTITLHNGSLEKPQPGKFAVIEDHSEAEKNPRIDITVGIYGLPRVYHPNWIISAKVA